MMKVNANSTRKLPDVSNRLTIESLSVTTVRQHLRPVIDLLERKGVQWNLISKEVSLMLAG